MPKRPTRKLHLIPAIGLLAIAGARFVFENWLPGTNWYQALDFKWIAATGAAFWLVLLLEDIVNRGSWVGDWIRKQRRLFVIDSFGPAQRRNELITPTIHLRTVREVHNALFVVRVRQSVNVKHVQPTVFVVKRVPISMAKDQRKEVVIAEIPAVAEPGQALGHPTWITVDDSKKHIGIGSDNIVEVEMRTGWRRQKEYLFLSIPIDRSSGPRRNFDPNHLLLVDGHRAGLEVVDTPIED